MRNTQELHLRTDISVDRSTIVNLIYYSDNFCWTVISRYHSNVHLAASMKPSSLFQFRCSLCWTGAALCWKKIIVRTYRRYHWRKKVNFSTNLAVHFFNCTSAFFFLMLKTLDYLNCHLNVFNILFFLVVIVRLEV